VASGFVADSTRRRLSAGDCGFFLAAGAVSAWLPVCLHLRIKQAPGFSHRLLLQLVCCPAQEVCCPQLDCPGPPPALPVWTLRPPPLLVVPLLQRCGLCSRLPTVGTVRHNTGVFSLISFSPLTPAPKDTALRFLIGYGLRSHHLGQGGVAAVL